VTATLCACGQPTPDAYLCTDCTKVLRDDLDAIPALREQLDLTLSRQTASGRQDGGRSAERPMPYHLGASDALEVLGAALRDASRSASCFLSPTAGGRIDVLAGLVADHLDELRQQPDAGQVARRIGDAVAKGRRSIDRQADRVFAGPCDGNGYTSRPVEASDLGCGDWLYARLGASDTKCPTCATSYDVGVRRAWMLEAAEDYLCHASLIAAAVTRLGESVKAGTIRQWAHRGRLEQRGVDDRKRPLYRVGDVLDLLAGDARRHAANSSSNGH
jgi:hypothetical protein